MVILIGVNGNKQKLSLVLLGYLLGHVNLGGEVVSLTRQEQQAVGLDLALKMDISYLEIHYLHHDLKRQKLFTVGKLAL